MKKISFLIILFVSISVQFSVYGQQRTFGEKFDPKDAMPMGAFMKEMQGKSDMPAMVEGKVSAVCQAKGCWMKLETGNGSNMRVSFKDYGFFVPKDLSGKTVVVRGVASMNTTSVEELRHYAEDAGKSKEEIAKITEPKTELVFEADGVIVR